MCVRLFKRNRLITFGLILCLIIVGRPATALSTDKDQDIEIEADAGELDDIKNITIYTGNVIVTRGSIRMTGDKMTVYYNEDDDIDTLIMEGKPATYRQLPDDSSVYDEADALRMEYHEAKNLVILIDEAHAKQEGGSFSGNRIEYDTQLSQVRAWSTPKGRSSATPEHRQRVKVIIKPKKKRSEAKSPEKTSK
ncbi:MAG: lipopolysaccharide transport periplasmic protein LptA [Gammaproteobacteria bacterium]